MRREQVATLQGGTWTPALEVDSGSISSYATQRATWQRDGEWLDVEFDIQAVSGSGGASIVAVSGLPFECFGATLRPARVGFISAEEDVQLTLFAAAGDTKLHVTYPGVGYGVPGTTIVYFTGHARLRIAS